MKHSLSRKSVGFGIALLLLDLALCGTGCSRLKTRTVATDGKEGKEATNAAASLDQAAAGLAKAGASARDQIVPANSRDVLKALNDHLKALPRKPDLELAAEERARLKAAFHLDEGELAELAATQFTPLDVNYLSFCYQLGDVIRSLDVQELPALERARRAFAWVVRQVTLLERQRQGTSGPADDPALPPQVALLTGRGTARERALVFLALLRQMRIDGCMVALPAGDKGKTAPWIPGVLIDRDEKDHRGKPVQAGIYLFDTRLGIPLPGPGGEGIARLEQVRKDPAPIRSLFPGPDGTRVVPAGVEKAEVALACPLSALSPRMRYLQKQLRAQGNQALAVDVEALRLRFRKATPAPVRFWSDAGDPNTPTRVLRAFLPGPEGGIDSGRRRDVVRELFYPRAQVRWGLPTALHTSFYPRVDAHIEQLFDLYVWKPRAALLRGRFDQATPALMAAQDFLRRLKSVFGEETRTDKDRIALRKEIDSWCKKMGEAFAELQLIQEEAREAGDDAGARQRLAEARSRVADLQKDNPKVMELMAYAAFERPLGEEYLYLLCLCMQDKAERLQTGLDRRRSSRGPAGELARTEGDARAAWQTAQHWWANYTEDFALTAKLLPHRLKILEAVVAQENANQVSPARAGLAAALYDGLLLDASRTVAARLMRARALQETGGADQARKDLAEQYQEVKSWDQPATREKLRDLARSYKLFRPGAWGHADPDTLSWLRIGLAFQVGRPQAAP